jgi:hypothetical protein
MRSVAVGIHGPHSKEVASSIQLLVREDIVSEKV